MLESMKVGRRGFLRAVIGAVVVGPSIATIKINTPTHNSSLGLIEMMHKTILRNYQETPILFQHLYQFRHNSELIWKNVKYRPDLIAIFPDNY